MLFDGIRLTFSDKSGSIIDCSNLIKVLVITAVTTTDKELRVKDVLTVTTVWNTIINKKLENDLLGGLTME